MLVTPVLQVQPAVPGIYHDTILLSQVFLCPKPEVCRGQQFFLKMLLLPCLFAIPLLNLFHGMDEVTPSLLTGSWILHIEERYFLVFQQKSSREEGLPTLLAFKLHLQLVELHVVPPLPGQMCPALLHAANGWNGRSRTTPSLIH